MCISFSPSTNEVWTKKNFGLSLPTDYPKEVFPGYDAPLVVKSHQSQRIAIGLAAFGLIPSWAKDQKIAKHTYNARSETVAIKPSYKAAWRERRLGIVLVDHFYEPNYESGKAQRWQIGLENNSPFGIATIWEQWVNPISQKKVISFSMLTINADAHPVMQRFHKPGEEKRTPLILHPTLHETWLNANSNELAGILNWEHFPSLIAKQAPPIT